MSTTKTKLTPKTQDVLHRITAMAAELGPDTKLPTVQQLRRDLQVSITTLDSALAHLEDQDVIYRRQGSGIYVSPHINKKTVGLVCTPDIFKTGNSPFWSEIVDDMRKRAASKGEVFRFYLSLPSGRSDIPVHEDLQDDVMARRLNGVIFIGVNDDVVHWIESHGVPVVNFAGNGTNKVMVDYDSLLEQALNDLVAHGCSKIGLMSPFFYLKKPEGITYTALTRRFIASLQERGLDVNHSWLWDGHTVENVEKSTYQEQGFDAAIRMFSNPEVARPDGIVIIDDMMTRGALVGLSKTGARPGQDVRIVTHTNRGSHILHGHENELVQLEVDPAEIVYVIFEMLHTLMRGQEILSSVVEVRPRLKAAQ